MTKFNLHTIDTAPAESKDILQKISDKWGFIPNFMAVIAEISSYARKLHGIE